MMKKIGFLCLFFFLLNIFCLSNNSSAERNYYKEAEEKEKISTKALENYISSLLFEEFMILGRQAAEDALKKGGTRVSEFYGISYLLGFPFRNELKSKAFTEKEAEKVFNKLFYSDKTWNIFIKEIKDKDAPWLWRKTVIGWSHPSTNKEEIKASTISPSTWLKLLKTCQTIMKDKEDNLEIREQAEELIVDLLPHKDRIFIDKSILQVTWQDVLTSAKEIANNNEDDVEIRGYADSLIPEIINSDYEKLKKNKPILLFAIKDELLNELQQDINKRIDLLRNPNISEELRFSSLGGLITYYKIGVSQSSRIRQEVLTTFYEEKQKKDKEFCLWIARCLAEDYNVYSIKQDLKEMYEQGNLDKETKNKLRNIIDDIEVLEEVGED